MSIGLDLAGDAFRSLRRQGNRLAGRASRAAYAVVLDHPARRALFAEKHVPFAQFGANLILFGDAAEEWSGQLRVSAIPLCIHGRLQMDDSVIRQVLAALIESLLPPPVAGSADCCLTLPAGLDQTMPAAVEFLSQVIRNCGYQPVITSASLAVALAELTPTGICGLGISLGTIRTEISVVRHGQELAHSEIPRGVSGGDIIEAKTALREIFATLAFELNRRAEWKALAKPIALAIAGDALAVPELAAELPGLVQHASWPFAIGAVKVAADPLWAVTRGCLIQAELEQLTAQVRAA